MSFGVLFSLCVSSIVLRSLWPGCHVCRLQLEDLVKGFTKARLTAHKEVLFHVPALHFIDERIGCLPLDEVLG
jgi:hypothetical protein